MAGRQFVEHSAGLSLRHLLDSNPDVVEDAIHAGTPCAQLLGRRLQHRQAIVLRTLDGNATQGLQLREAGGEFGVVVGVVGLERGEAALDRSDLWIRRGCLQIRDTVSRSLEAAT